MADKMAHVVEIEQKTIAIENNTIGAPVYYIDGIQGLSVINDAVKLNLYSLVQEVGPGETSAPLKKVIVARVVMTPGVFIGVVKWLADRAAGMEASSADQGATDANA